MHHRRKSLSIDDRKAVDVCLDHAASAASGGVTRMTSPVAQHRITATTKLLAILAELPVIEPPAGLAAKTMKFIDQQEGQIAPQDHHRASANSNATLH